MTRFQLKIIVETYLHSRIKVGLDRAEQAQLFFM